MDNIPIVTIDGPSGTGKGTIAVKLAQDLNWNYLDSGALYRAVSLELADHISVSNIDIDLLSKKIDELSLDCAINDQRKVIITVNDKNVTSQIRSEETGALASKISVYKEVREYVNCKLREFKRFPGLVADGRDLGTVVFPESNCKIYLYADPDIRAQRRYNQLKKEEINVNLTSILKNVMERDKRDMNRKVAPLKRSVDAISIDTSKLTIEEVFMKVKKILQKKIWKK